MSRTEDVEHRDVTLREMLEAMAGCPDDEVFRWFQPSYVQSDGSIHHTHHVLRLTVGQLRRELGMTSG